MTGAFKYRFGPNTGIVIDATVSLVSLGLSGPLSGIHTESTTQRFPSFDEAIRNNSNLLGFFKLNYRQTDQPE